MLLTPLWVDAAGLGNITVHSLLGQPLRAEVRVTATEDELAGMVARLASREIFEQAGVRYTSTSRQLRFSLEKAAGGAVVKVTSDGPVNDPFMDFMLELSWPAGRLTREYTFLIDPPDQPVRAQPKTVETVRPAAPVVARQVDKALAGEHVVKPGETLYRIAMNNLPAGATLEQMQIALYRGNPDAFDGGITRLRVGAVLKIPAQAEVMAISRDEAQKTLRPQSKAGGSGQGKTNAVAESKTPKRAGPTEKNLEARKKNIREFKKNVDVMEAEVRKLQEQIKSKDETLAEIERQKEERKAALQAAAAATEAQKTPEPEPVSMPPVSPEVPVVPEEPPLDIETVPPGEGQPEEVPPTEVEPEENAESDEASATEPPPVPPQIAGRPVQPSASLDTQEPEEKGAGLLTWVLGGVAALVVLVLGFLFLRRRGGSGDDGGDSMTTSKAIALDTKESLSQGFSTKGPSSVFQRTDAGGQSVDTNAVTVPPTSEFSRVGPGMIDTDEVDPVAEADVYMAYGRDGQAEEILLDALQKDPHRLAIHVKLLEVYASRKSVKDFETLAAELYAQTGGRGAEWEKVTELGRALNPGNPLYGGGAGQGAGTDVAAAPSSFDLGIDEGLAKETPKFNLVATDAVAPPAPVDVDFTGSFSFGLGTTDSEPSPEGVDTLEDDDPLLALLQEEATSGAKDDQKVLGEAPAPVSASKADASLDFDFPVEKAAEPASVPSPAPLHVLTPKSASSEPEPSTISQAILGFDQGGGNVTEQPADDSAATIVNPDIISDSAETVVNTNIISDSAETVLNSAAISMDTGPDSLVDFDLDIPDSVKPAATRNEMGGSDDVMAATSIMGIEPDDDLEFDISLTKSTVLGNPGGGGFGLSGISLDLGASNALPAQVPDSAAEPEILADAIMEDEGGIVADSRRDEVNTKLDLAKAYEEMGDLEGARELLGEVVGEGAPDQAAEAQAMLNRLNV
jgi:pilus assembly protein FimV